MAQEFGPGTRIGDFVGSNPGEMVGGHIADAVARGLDRVQFVLRQIGEGHSKTPGQVALRWLIENDCVLPIPGAKNGRPVYCRFCEPSVMVSPSCTPPCVVKPMMSPA